MHTLSRFGAALPLLASALIAGGAGAQVTQQPAGGSASRIDSTGVGDTSIFAPFQMLPSANVYRAGSGAPGARYWQNRADYALKATLDTANKTVRGEMRLKYTNNSPDTLYYVWLQTEQNAFRNNSLNSFIFPQNSRFGARGFEGGYVFERMNQVNAAGRSVPVTSREQETVTKVKLAQPLAPGRSTTLDVAWHFAVPEHGADRMGRDGALYEIAQWYPRMAVYDDVRGWNTEPYLGQGEFYLEYGDFTLDLTVPAGYVVAATGQLQNAREVLTPAEVSRLAQAAHSETPVAIISAAELQSGAARPTRSGTQTWRFTAQNVRDAVWAASPDFQWDASSWNGIMAHAFYRPSAVATWKDAADMSRMSILEYSTRWFQYPYPQITAIEGPISGMEYPMVAMENRSEDKYDLYNVITHEIGHMWFPMIVGSNERVHMWQDEGFNTFINYFSEARRFPERGDQITRAKNDMRLVERYMQGGVDKPLEVNPDRIDPRLLGENAYVKTAVGLQMLRHEILGDSVFDDAFRTYVDRWAFKHPTPADFYRTMEDASGRRLDWFWREWFQENPHFDQAIDSVVTQAQGNGSQAAVLYGNHARGVLPIHARFTFNDGSVENYDYPAEVWSTNTREYLRTYQWPNKRLVRVELDPEQRVIDTNRANNVWGTGARAPQP